MSFLTPWTAAIAAGIAIPSLLLLYFLKLRRQEVIVSTTLLWKKAIQDLQVNAPFQKLRRNLLLFLQLLVLLAALIALSSPISEWTGKPGAKVVILIDHSASMNAMEADGATRLTAAREAALAYVRGLVGDCSIKVIEFADQARTVCQFTKDRTKVSAAIESIQPCDGPSRLSEALQLALAHAAQTRLEMPSEAVTIADDVEVALFSDGRISDADDQVVRRGEMKYFKVGSATDNVGITAMDVQREYENPARLSVFTTIENFSNKPVETNVSLRLDGTKTLSAEKVTLGPAVDPNETRPDSDRSAALPSRSVVFELDHESGGVLEVIVHRKDALDVDNTCAAPIDPPRRIRVLVVTDRPNVFYVLNKALSGMPLETLDSMGTAEYEGSEELKQDSDAPYDLIIMDQYSTEKLPRTAYLFFGGVPLIDGVSMGAPITDDYVVTWDETHPLMRFVEFGNINIRQWNELKTPDHAVPLVEGRTSNLIVHLPTPGRQFVLVAFELAETDWWQREPWVVFLVNVTRFFSAGGGGTLTNMIRPGDTILLPPMTGEDGELTMERPDHETDTITVDPTRQPVYAKTDRAGVYTCRGADENETFRTAVNLLDPVESDIAPADLFTLGSEQVTSRAGDETVNNPLWGWLIIAALGFLLIEWWIYNRRVMI